MTQTFQSVSQSLDLGTDDMSVRLEPGGHLPQPHNLPIQDVKVLPLAPLSPCCPSCRAAFAAATESIEPSLSPALFSTATELKTMEKSPSWSPKKLGQRRLSVLSSEMRCGRDQGMKVDDSPQEVHLPSHHKTDSLHVFQIQRLSVIFRLATVRRLKLAKRYHHPG